MDESWFTGEPPHKGLPPVRGFITLDGRVQVRREVDAGSQRRNMIRDNMCQSHQEADGGASAKTETPGCPAGQRKTVGGGLRILAGIIERTGRNAPAHPRRFRGCFLTPGPVDALSRTPASIAFSASRPEPAINSRRSWETPVEGDFPLIQL